MASQYEVEITIASARDLKNVNWRCGDLSAYAVAWIDHSAKCSTKVAVDGDTNPVWDEKLTLPLTVPLQDAALYLDVVHAGAAKDTKPLVGSARLYLREVVDDVGIGGKAVRTLKLRRPSGRPQGKLEVKVAVKEPGRYYGPAPAAYAPPYSQPSSRGVDYGYSQPYGAAPPAGYPYGTAPPPPTGYSYGAPPPVAAPSGYGAPAPSGYGAPAPSGYGAPAPSGYGASAPAYGQDGKKSRFGMGTGLAVGAAAGVLGGLVLAEGIEHVEDSIADKAADKVEDDLYCNDGGYDDGGYDDGGF